jgi:hypothetical protein
LSPHQFCAASGDLGLHFAGHSAIRLYLSFGAFKFAQAGQASDDFAQGRFWLHGPSSRLPMGQLFTHSKQARKRKKLHTANKI